MNKSLELTKNRTPLEGNFVLSLYKNPLFIFIVFELLLIYLISIDIISSESYMYSENDIKFRAHSTRHFLIIRISLDNFNICFPP